MKNTHQIRSDPLRPLAHANPTLSLARFRDMNAVVHLCSEADPAQAAIEDLRALGIWLSNVELRNLLAEYDGNINAAANAHFEGLSTRAAPRPTEAVFYSRKQQRLSSPLPSEPSSSVGSASGSQSVQAPRQESRPAMPGTSGWHVELEGRYDRYPQQVQLELECAWHRGTAGVTIAIDGQTFEVEFCQVAGGAQGGLVATQRGNKSRKVLRHVPNGAPELLMLAQVVAHPACARDVLEYVSRLGAAIDALKQAMDRVKATRDDWITSTIDYSQNYCPLLRGHSIFLVGRFLFGCGEASGSRRGKLHSLITECGGKIQSAAAPNGNTTMLVRGLADDEEHASCLYEARKVNGKRKAKGGGKAPPMYECTEVDFAEQLSGGGSGEGCFPWQLKQLYETTALRRQRQTLLRLALSSAAWQRFEASEPRPLQGLHVAMTGCMLLMSGGEQADTHTELKLFIKRCGGEVVPSVSKASTDLLLVGRGEKGEDGKETGKGEDPRSSGKYKAADDYNASLEKEGKPPIVILSEEELLPWLLSAAAKERIAHAASRTPKAPSAIKAETANPFHKPDLRAVRFTSTAQRAHGCGEPGGKGSVLADALAAPQGYTLASALVTAQSINASFVWTMLQMASVADDAPPDLAPEVTMVHWEADPNRRSQSDGAPWQGPPLPVGDVDVDSKSEASAASSAAPSAERAESESQESKWLGSGAMEEAAARGTWRLPIGANPHLDRLIELRRKPRLKCAYRLTADTTIERCHGQVHSKFWMLRFASTMRGDDAEVVRLVVSSGNAQTGAYGGVPERRSLLGLWWADFDCSPRSGASTSAAAATAPTAPASRPCSAFRATLLHHVEALLASKKRHGAGSFENRAAAEASWRRMRDAWERADTSTADAAGTTLVSHVPGIYPLPSGHTPCAVPMGMAALHDCFRRALRHPRERLDLAVVAHCANGWSAGHDGAERLREWCTGAAPNGGTVRFHWPRRDALSILGKARSSSAVRDGYMENEAPEWLKAAPLVGLRLRDDVISKGGHLGYQATPHLMLYVLHEPIETDGDAPRIRRLLLTSANFSAAPWGYARDQKLEVRNFELGVLVEPQQPEDLVAPLGDLRTSGGGARSQKAWAEAIPFHLEGREPCHDPFLGHQQLVRSQGKAEKGQLNY